MEVSTPESQKTGTTEYETAKSTTSSMSQGMRGHEPGAKRLDKEDLKLTSAEMIAKLNVLAVKKGQPPPPQKRVVQPHHATPAVVRMLPPIPKVNERVRPSQASFTPAPPNRQNKAKKDKKSRSGELEGDRALRLQKEAWEKQQRKESKAAAKAAKAAAATAASDCESTSSWSSAVTTRSSSSKRAHSPGETTAVKK